MELQQQAGFADTRLAHEKNDLPPPRPGLGPALLQEGQLRLPSHKRGESPFCAHLEPGAQPAGAHDLVRVDGLRFALDRLRAQGPGDKVAAHDPVGVLSEDDLTWLRQVQHARRQIRRIPHGRVVHTQIVTDTGHHHETRVQPHAHAKRDPLGALQFSAVALQGALHAQGRVHCPLGMVLMGNGGTKERHDAVAQELVDCSFIAVHLTQHQLKGPVHEVVDVFGVEFF